LPQKQSLRIPTVRNIESVIGQCEIDWHDGKRCGGAVKIIASIEDPEVIGRILQHLGLDRSEDCSRRLPAVRAPPSG
jgi:hypothetical protein